MCSPTDVSALVPTNACRHSKLLDKHAVRDDQPLRTVVDVGKAIAHGDMRSVNGASSERDHAMHRTRATTVRCCAQFHSPDESQKSDGHVPACHHMNHARIQSGHHNPQQGGNVNPSIAFCSHRRREERSSLCNIISR